MPITAEIILDSISPENIRLTTMRLRYPKFIHGEFMTHRVFSRNASSSRAIPISKSLEEVRNPYLRAQPEEWKEEQRGMEGGNFLTEENLHMAEYLWEQAAYHAAYYAEQMQAFKVHKSIANRIIEPFLHINTLVTATEYDNFFGLRLDKSAQPEMRILAEKMWKVREESIPKLLQPGEWHLPFITEKDCVVQRDEELFGLDRWSTRSTIFISVALCARVSYTSFETRKSSTIEEDLKLYDRLVSSNPAHLSPAEHQATPDIELYISNDDFVKWTNQHQHGNLQGWRQYRKMLPNESIANLPQEYQK